MTGPRELERAGGPRYARSVEVEVKLVPTASSYPLRQAILRPHQTIEEMAWERDDEPGTATFGAVERSSGAVVGVVTVFREPAPFAPGQVAVLSGAQSHEATWRLRGMATRADLQGHGIGSLVLNTAMGHVAGECGTLLWCNARVSAVGFYERAGFRTWGDEWVLASIGPHVVMWRGIQPKEAQ